MRDDERLGHDALDRALTDLPGEVAGDELRAGRGHLEVAAGELRMRVRVDDVADRTRAGERADRREQPIRPRLGHRVHDQHALGSDLHEHVDAARADHRDLSAHRQGFQVGRLSGERGSKTDGGKQHQDCPNG